LVLRQVPIAALLNNYLPQIADEQIDQCVP
jgi:hypothetical protein